MTRRTMHVRRATGCAKSARPRPIRSRSRASRFERSSHRLKDVVALAPCRHSETTPVVICFGRGLGGGPRLLQLVAHVLTLLRRDSATLAQVTSLARLHFDEPST